MIGYILSAVCGLLIGTYLGIYVQGLILKPHIGDKYDQSSDTIIEDSKIKGDGNRLNIEKRAKRKGLIKRILTKNK